MSRSTRAGLIVLGVLSVLDLLLPLLTDGEHPPMAIALVAAALGLASLVLVVSAWRGATRAVVPLVVLRALSALGAVPAAVVPGVPQPAIIAAGAGVLLTAVGIVLVLASRVTAGAR
ncbi:hypothetical protein FKR81_19725 [Lentzea tibetensis]|uniref:Uncharacterized protein n=1 Tax=Lentzea tibetensis TaxID=2591470 RepID=A0A563ESB8_9PSEU|nr:hypothetical protein [Lentzea tibetensis]TWP50411.1 hypothetical protein FKR81_19725 [Lentzea tibetensis]